MSIPAELSSLDAWRAASADRRNAIAEQIAAAHDDLSFEALLAYGDPELPIASFWWEPGRLRFLLVPGGRYDMGLSDDELATIRAAADAADEESNYEEEFGMLLEDPPARPVHAEEVGPLLVAQGPLIEIDLDAWSEALVPWLFGEDAPDDLPDDLDGVLARAGFRLPWEREWEWLARGGRAHQLNYLDNEVPDEGLLAEAADAAETWVDDEPADTWTERANDFGLVGFGAHPEICADRYRETYAGTAERCGPDQPRTTRGGAALIAPWQECGEWQLLLNAMRITDSDFRWSIAVRLVRDLG